MDIDPCPTGLGDHIPEAVFSNPVELTCKGLHAHFLQTCLLPKEPLPMLETWVSKNHTKQSHINFYFVYHTHVEISKPNR